MGKQRINIAKDGHAYTPNKTVRYEKYTKALYYKKYREIFLKGAISAHILVYSMRPKYHYGTGKNSLKLKKRAPEYDLTKPDVDNIAKIILDALNGIAYKDDNQIIELYIKKSYALNKKFEGIWLTLKEVP